MAHILLDVLLVGAVASFASKLLRRGRTVTPVVQQNTRRNPPVPEPIRTRPSEANHVETAKADGIQPGAGRYLLDGASAHGSTDRTAAMMDMMSGSGVCTPRKL